MFVSEKYNPYVRRVEGFPSDGITFYDISPLIGDGEMLREVIHDIAEPVRGKVNKVVGFDARGFLFAGAVAAELGIGTAMLRKPGKLPGEVYKEDYTLEYGVNSLEIQADALAPGERALLIDDVIATGGTALAGIRLVQNCGADVAEFCSLIDLPEFGGSASIRAAGIAVRSLMTIGGHNGTM